MIVYLGEAIDAEALAKLKKETTVVTDFGDLKNIDAIIVRVKRITRDMIQKAKNLKVIGMHGIGCDTIDLAAAREFGVKVINVPTGNVEAVAELAIGYMLDLSRKITLADGNLKAGKYTVFSPPELTGTELMQKTVGLIGAGHIGRRIAEILRLAFHCEIAGYDPYCSDDIFEKYHIIRKNNVKDLIQGADIVNVSVPLNQSTKNIIGKAEMDAFRKSALLICTSHGGIVSESALYDALVRKKLAGAACDVFLQDPPDRSNPLLSLSNLIATPHIGGNTHESLQRVGNEIVDSVLECLKGHDVPNRVV